MRQSRRPSRFPLIGFHTLVIILFFALAYGAYHASTKFRKVQTSFTLSNGTHLFAPTTILISLDGFRADFLNRGLTPTLNEFISQGVSPRYMLPSFPSVTFPNHFTMVTGLYPESHGIVSNTFWDPDLKEEFVYTNKASSMQSKWWNAEPLWVTAEKQGVRTAVHMWPGSEAHIPPIEPTYVDQYNGAEELNRKVDRILGWLDLPGDADHAVTTDLRPQLIAAYVRNVDADGHLYGPNSTEIRATISQVDSMLADLFHGLYDRNLTSVVNIVIVSDHGMATTSNERLVQLDDLIDLDLVEHIDGWPLRGLRLKHPEQDLQPMYERLVAESAKSDGFEVYTRDNMPARYHFSNNDRIAPLWVIPKAGWAIVERNDFDIVQAEAEGRVFRPKGIHGYDHEHPLMRAIAVMRGPSFPHKPNSQVPIFQNTEVYNIVCDSVGIMPHLNNGSLRLPLKPIGLHDSPIPDTFDPPPSDVEDNADTSSDVHDAVQPTAATGEGSPSDVEQETPSQDSEQGQADEDTSSVEGTTSDGTSWLDFFKDRLEKAKQWANSVLENLKNNGWHEAEAEDSSGS